MKNGVERGLTPGSFNDVLKLTHSRLPYSRIASIDNKWRMANGAWRSDPALRDFLLTPPFAIFSLRFHIGYNSP